jgi:hypothetical protein
MFAEANTSAFAPAGDLILQQTGGAEFRLHRIAGCRGISCDYLGEGAAQASSGVTQHCLSRRVRGGQQSDECDNGTTLRTHRHAPGSPAFG